MPELRLFLEEVCCDILEFRMARDPGIDLASVRVDRDVHLGLEGAFADVRVTVPQRPTTFIEIKYGHRDAQVLERIRRKYSSETPVNSGPGRLVLVVDTRERPGWAHTEAEIARSLRPGLELEVWGDDRVLAELAELFDLHPNSVDVQQLLEVRQGIERAKGFHAFGGTSIATYEHDPLRAQLLWHFGHRFLGELRALNGKEPRDILPPGHYPSVVVLLADLCGFASFVRDTRDDGVIRQSLTSFYSRARHQIHEAGGMLYSASSDYVIGLFGLPEQSDDYASRALEAGRALISIGTAVSSAWQRQIDRDQASGGVHVAISLGDLQIFSLQPFSRTHMGAVGDAMNVAGELISAAAPGEIAVTNPFHQLLDVQEQSSFTDSGTTQTRRLGQIRHWKLAVKLEVLDTSDESGSLGALDPVRMLSKDYTEVVRLGQGGMGLVFRATHRADQTVVAVKVLSPALAVDPIFVKRFMREVKALSVLKHPNIVTIVTSRTQPMPHYAMEYVPWPDLRARVGAGALPLPDALHIARQVADALASAHQSGVVHRDVKPGNVLVGHDNQVKLVDFGIASVAGETGVTVTGQNLGTPQYMAPEQLEGVVIGPPADVYALGLLMFEMIQGAPAFEPLNVLSRVAQPPDRLPPHPVLEGALSALVDSCLRPAPSDRPAAVDIVSALDGFSKRLMER